MGIITASRARRIVVIGAFAAAAVAAPTYAALSAPTPSSTPQAECLAWLGARGTGTCISYSNSSGAGQTGFGSPGISVGGPNSGSPGISTGPLLPGQTINVPLG
ncbi:DUF7155 family protein [Mycolicibacterium komossense]|uniref:Uncharacterized protein n=1 Tax=Mycolicibacterium komossense TaxID=1779 RepID=A0ABT3C5Z0_9MYCO|nr:hypothetical protein [Mycolicibacterium komossense]MCV7224894.1 hypothetical protein [Mycolicibacterium komossense]